MTIDVDIQGPAIRGLSRVRLTKFVGDCVGRLRSSRALSFTPDEVSIVFVDDTTMKRLNRKWRKKNRTTDVLTFEGEEDEPIPGAPRSLGEIIISIEQAKRQAREERHALSTEIRYLVLHGLIHALGYDHETDEGEMDALELRIRPRVGLK